MLHAMATWCLVASIELTDDASTGPGGFQSESWYDATLLRIGSLFENFEQPGLVPIRVALRTRRRLSQVVSIQQMQRLAPPVCAGYENPAALDIPKHQTFHPRKRVHSAWRKSHW